VAPGRSRGLDRFCYNVKRSCHAFAHPALMGAGRDFPFIKGMCGAQKFRLIYNFVGRRLSTPHAAFNNHIALFLNLPLAFAQKL